MTIDLITVIILIGVGFIAGAINAAVGAGTLIVFSALLGLGLPPVLANGTNTTGLSFGGVSSALAYRAELKNRLRILRMPMLLTFVAAILGSSLVVVLPDRVFVAVVPWLIILATLLVATGPLILRRFRSWSDAQADGLPTADLPFWAALVAVYGGYFGAGQGVMYMAVLGLRYDASVQRCNGAKNLLASVANISAALVFIIAGQVVFLAALAIAFGAMLGGYLGGRVARKLPEVALRALGVVVGFLAAGYVLIHH